MINLHRLVESISHLHHLAGEKQHLCQHERPSVDRLAGELFVLWCKKAGCSVRLDHYGNIFAVRMGRAGHLHDAVMIGGFLGGDNDGRGGGLCGVLVGLEIIRSLNEKAIQTERAIVVVGWKSEESARFYAGFSGVSHYLSTRSGFDIFADIESGLVDLQRQDWRLDACADWRMVTPSVYVGLHLDAQACASPQAPRLTVVERANGAIFFDVSIDEGEEASGGNAFLAMVRFVELLERFLRNFDRDIIFDVGNLCIGPDSINNAAHRIDLSVGVRHGSKTALARIDSQLQVFARKVVAEYGFALQVRKVLQVPPVRFSSFVRDGLAWAAQHEGSEMDATNSRAIHDASFMASLCHAGVVSVPVRKGTAPLFASDDERAGLKLAANAMFHCAVRFG